jgi:hypothetical protein
MLKILNNFPVCEHHDCPHTNECGQYQQSVDGLAPVLNQRITKEREITCGQRFHEFRVGEQVATAAGFVPKAISDGILAELQSALELPNEECYAAINKKIRSIDDENNVLAGVRSIVDQIRIEKAFVIAESQKLFSGVWEYSSGYGTTSQTLKARDNGNLTPLIKVFQAGYHDRYECEEVKFVVNDYSYELIFKDKEAMFAFAERNAIKIDFKQLDSAIRNIEGGLNSTIAELAMLKDVKAALQVKKS